MSEDFLIPLYPIITLVIIILCIFGILLFYKFLNKDEEKRINSLPKIELSKADKEVIAKYFYNVAIESGMDFDGYVGRGWIEEDILKIIHDKYGKEIFGEYESWMLEDYRKMFGVDKNGK